MWNPLKAIMGMFTPKSINDVLDDIVEDIKSERIEPTMTSDAEEAMFSHEAARIDASAMSHRNKRKAEARRNNRNAGQRRSRKNRDYGNRCFGDD